MKLGFVRTVITADVNEAAKFLREGGTVAFPTETVYGLGANVFDAEAVAKIFEAKQRPADNPLIAHVASIDQIGELVTQINKDAEVLINRFFPGPLTLVLPKSDAVPLIATAGLNTIGVRMPRFEVARAFLTACGVPVVAPSANLSGKPSPTTWQAVLEDLDGRIDCILQGDATEIGLESTVVDCTGDVPMLLRKGAVSIAQLQAVVRETIEYSSLSEDSPRSPGLKHRHYKPKVEVVIVDSIDPDDIQNGSAYIGLQKEADPRHFSYKKVCSSVDEYAHSLFEFLRECDRMKIQTVYCESVPATGIGAALMDRLRRAAAG